MSLNSTSSIYIQLLIKIRFESWLFYNRSIESYTELVYYVTSPVSRCLTGLSCELGKHYLDELRTTFFILLSSSILCSRRNAFYNIFNHKHDVLNTTTNLLQKQVFYYKECHLRISWRPLKIITCYCHVIQCYFS